MPETDEMTDDLNHADRKGGVAQVYPILQEPVRPAGPPGILFPISLLQKFCSKKAQRGRKVRVLTVVNTKPRPGAGNEPFNLLPETLT